MQLNFRDAFDRVCLSELLCKVLESGVDGIVKTVLC